MEQFIAPNGRIINIPKGRVMTYRLSEGENRLIEQNLPSSEYELYVADTASDILAIRSDIVMLKASELTEEEREIITEYYQETKEYLNQTVYWLGYPRSVSNLRSKFCCHECVEMAIGGNLKLKLLEAERKNRRIRGFSKKLADTIGILSLIRSHQGIKTAELAKHMELPIRTVQRYITALQAAGEDVFFYLRHHGFLEKDAWRGMEHVRKGLGLSILTDEMKCAEDSWKLERISRISFLPGKADIVEQVLYDISDVRHQ